MRIALAETASLIAQARARYDEPTKIPMRQRLLKRAVEALTVGRGSSYCLPNTATESKKASDLNVVYLAGPCPSNDAEELVKLGVLPENITAVDSESYPRDDRLRDGVRLYASAIQNCFLYHRGKFDIIYLDLTASIFDGQTCQAVASVFTTRALTSLSVLITNFGEAAQKHATYLARISELCGSPVLHEDACSLLVTSMAHSLPMMAQAPMFRKSVPIPEVDPRHKVTSTHLLLAVTDPEGEGLLGSLFPQIGGAKEKWPQRRAMLEIFACDYQRAWENELVVGKHTMPYIYNPQRSARWSYRAEDRKHSMTTDLFVFDECRYIFDAPEQAALVMLYQLTFKNTGYTRNLRHTGAFTEDRGCSGGAAAAAESEDEE